jgi:hypothetical protein
VAPFFLKYKIMNDNNEDLRPSKMRGVVFPKAKYGVIAAIIIIILVNLIYYKESVFSFFR